MNFICLTKYNEKGVTLISCEGKSCFPDFYVVPGNDLSERFYMKSKYLVKVLNTNIPWF